MRADMSRPLVRGALLRREILPLNPATANFATYLQLTGLRAVAEGGRFEMGLRCRLLRAVPGPLCCFFHVLGEGGEKPLEGQVLLDDDSPLAAACRGDDLLIAAEHVIPPDPS